MFGSPLWDAFVAHQARILHDLGVVDDLLSVGGNDAVDGLGRHRWALVRHLREYQIFKHSRIFDPAIRSGVRTRRAAALDLKASCILGGEEFTGYVRFWSGRSVTDEWLEYRSATIRINADLRAHLAQEGLGAARLLR